MSGRAFVPPEEIVAAPPGESPRCTTMSPTLYHVSSTVPSGPRVTPAVRPRANSAFSTSAGAVHGPAELDAVDVTSPSIGITAAKNARNPPDSASSVGSAPRLHPETIVVEEPTCPAAVIGVAWTAANPALHATFRRPSEVRATPSSCEEVGAFAPETMLVQRPGVPAGAAAAPVR